MEIWRMRNKFPSCLDFPNAFVSPGVNSRGELVPSHGASRRRLGDKNAVRLILDNFGSIGFLFFGRIPVASSHFSLHFDSILSPKIVYFERFKAQFSPSVRTNWRLTVLKKDVAY
jgi:hypothetical protein